MACSEETRQRLLTLIKEKALQVGDFVLASGKKSNYYLDCRKVTLDPEGAYLVASAILDMIADEEVDAVGGMTMGADPIAGAVAALSFERGRPVRAFLVRKEPKDHGTRQQVEGHLGAGVRVVIVDDVATTAGSSLKAIAALEREIPNIQILRVIPIVDREEGGRANVEGEGYRFTPIFTKTDLGLSM